MGKMLTNRDASLKVLEILNGSDSRNILVKMLLQGYEPNQEPYLSMMLQAHYDNLLSDLKSRCRIFVPKGRILVGCLDETGILNYGQVYVRITMSKAELQSGDQSFFRKVDETTCIIVGKVVVTKNPCLHPGDIRVLEAIYVVELEEKGLVDCLIFPQNGQRKSKSFFVDYMINDTLGAISTAHLVHADREPDNALSKKCLELANLHSMAVNFAKTGAPAEMPRVWKPKEFPDFMERVDKPMYTSNNVLGKLYRATVESTVQERPNLVQLEKFSKETYDNDLEVDGFEAFLEIAEKHKDQYIEKMTSLMKYY
ncbi:RNA-dependent RNA polymerase 2-like isoform X1 [Quercus robur]|uniref:RNA-dependent RNA polymerase 2-like isoform X1 n=1 Tax=Quercus robur TaxID=38942 RepID=UPI0021635DB2|nr:RNA-dependent RNA polymerase 2-like isoform X1 [Quercus robur]